MHRRLGRQELTFNPAQQSCFTGGDQWNYCVHSTPTDKPDTYLYVFHGKDQNEKSWSETAFYSGLLQRYWQQTYRRTPVVITVSLGPIWLITPPLSKEGTGTLDLFNQEVFKKIEADIGAPQQRFLMGVSMGALNALSLTLNNPKLFQRVVVLCPPVFKISPYASSRELLSFLKSSGAQVKSLFTLIGIGQTYFANDHEWNLFSPLEIAKGITAAKLPPLYITSGLRDEFGNFLAVEELVESLKSRGAKVDWRPNSGDHCSVDIVSLAEFLKIDP